MNDDQNIDLIIVCDDVIFPVRGSFSFVLAHNRHFLQFHLAHNNNFSFLHMSVIGKVPSHSEIVVAVAAVVVVIVRGTKMEIKLLFCDNCMSNCACHFAATSSSLRLLSSASKERHLRIVKCQLYLCENRLNFSPSLQAIEFQNRRKNYKRNCNYQPMFTMCSSHHQHQMV